MSLYAKNPQLRKKSHSIKKGNVAVSAEQNGADPAFAALMARRAKTSNPINVPPTPPPFTYPVHRQSYAERRASRHSRSQRRTPKKMTAGFSPSKISRATAEAEMSLNGAR